MNDPMYDLFEQDEWAKWLYRDLKADKVKQVRGKRCSCGFFLAKIHEKHICAYCLGNNVSASGWDRNIVKQTVLYGPYSGRTHFGFWQMISIIVLISIQIEFRKNTDPKADTFV